MKGALVSIFPFGVAAGLVLIGVQALEYSYLRFHLTQEVYLGSVALVFMVLGMVAGARWLRRPDHEVQEHHPDGRLPVPHAGQNPTSALPPSLDVLDASSRLTEREVEVLRELARGFTNQQIAEHLFISLNTAKTHVSRVYAKLGVERRTQAVEKARELGLLS